MGHGTQDIGHRTWDTGRRTVDAGQRAQEARRGAMKERLPGRKAGADDHRAEYTEPVWLPGMRPRREVLEWSGGSVRRSRGLPGRTSRAGNR